jgi:hypothetical protein
MFNPQAIAQRAPQAKQRFTYQCPECGSQDVAHDATAAWDSELQRYVLTAIQDYVSCRVCHHYDDHGTSFFKVLEA